MAVRVRLALAGLAVLLAAPFLPPLNTSGASQSRPDFGFLALATSTTPVGGIGSTEVTLTSLHRVFSVTDPNFDNRYVKFTAVIRVATSVAPATVDAYIDITDDNLNPPNVFRAGGASIRLDTLGGSGAETMTIIGYCYCRVSTWEADVKVRRTAGTGTVNVAQPAISTQSLLAEDLGA